jgi:hypothetical protein
VGGAEKRFCEAKTFGARGSRVEKRLMEPGILTLRNQRAPPFKLAGLGWYIEKTTPRISAGRP